MITELVLNSLSATPNGRVSNHFQYPDDLLPVSCRLIVFDGHLPNLLFFVTKFLKEGSGVKVYLSNREDTQVELQKPVKHQYYLITKESDRELIPVAKYREFVVEDSLLGGGSILYYLVRFALCREDVVVDLTKLRPAGTTNSKGLVASGPESFAELFHAVYRYKSDPTVFNLLYCLGKFNSVIRRGGLYKNGIITTAIHLSSNLLPDYLEATRRKTELPGSHQTAVELDRDPTDEEWAELVELRNRYSLFLSKPHSDPKRYWNVCMGLAVPHLGTCLIWRANLGRAVNIDCIPQLIVDAAVAATTLHCNWKRGPGDSTPEDDRQIGVCVMGLCNLLVRFGINYQDFIDALNWVTTEATPIVHALFEGYRRAEMVVDELCHRKGWATPVLLWTVEPAQSHAYGTEDLDGVTTCRGLLPPLSQRLLRQSDTESGVYYYPGFPVLGDLTEDELWQLYQGYYRLMNATGRAHSISADTYHDLTVERLKEWYFSPLPTLYYHKGTEVLNADNTSKLDLPSVDDEVEGFSLVEGNEGCSVCAG